MQYNKGRFNEILRELDKEEIDGKRLLKLMLDSLNELDDPRVVILPDIFDCADMSDRLRKAILLSFLSLCVKVIEEQTSGEKK